MVEFISLAKKKAEKSEQYFRHCCVVWKGGSILAWGINNGFGHAEANALASMRSASGGPRLHLERAKFLSIRITRTGRLAMAKPCAKCADLLRSYKMTGWYSTSDGRLEPWK